MINVNNPESLSQAKLSFVPVPEVAVTDLKALGQRLHKRGNQKLPSYGAYLIRQAGQDNTSSFMTCYGVLRGATHPPHSLPLEQAYDSYLHDDDGLPNAVTAHFTDRGAADVIILPEADKWAGMSSSLTVATLDLFATGTYLYNDGLPSSALRTTVGAGDLLVFDHSQPHAFQSTTDDRRSTAYYYY